MIDSMLRMFVMRAAAFGAAMSSLVMRRRLWWDTAPGSKVRSCSSRNEMFGSLKFCMAIVHLNRSAFCSAG